MFEEKTFLLFIVTLIRHICIWFTPSIMKNAEHEKKSAALASVFAAIFLTAMKVVVGVMTNSLGVISEAIHSAFDLIAAGMTYVAVRVSAAPPNSSHPYGLGKIENFSALVESLLLLVTCGWIMWEAFDRLFFNPVDVSPSLWAVGVMVVSIIVDISRSRMLKAVAEKHHSQALEADALHFSTDIWSSTVVLVGFGGLYLAELLPPESPFVPWLNKADALAGLGVALIIIKVSWSLCVRAFKVLLDAGDLPMTQEIEEGLKSIEGVGSVIYTRIRHSGSDVFVDMEISVAKTLLMEEAERVREAAVEVVRQVVPRASVSIALRPEEISTDLVSLLRGEAAVYGLVVHSVEVLDFEDKQGRKQFVEMHAEFEPSLSLEKAHSLVTAFEEQIGFSFPHIMLITHIEPMGEYNVSTKTVAEKACTIEKNIRKIVEADTAVSHCHRFLITDTDKGRRVSFHCEMPGTTTVHDAHEKTVELHEKILESCPDIFRTTIHMEPLGRKK